MHPKFWNLDDWQHAVNLWLTTRYPTVGIHQLEVDTPEPTSEMLTAWTQNNAQFLETAREKLQEVLPPQKRERFVQQLARLYVRGETALQILDADYPAIADSAKRLKAQREETLEAESLLTTDADAARLRGVIKAFDDHLFEQIPGVSRNVAEQLAWAAAADWIFRCPMSF